MSHPPGFEAWWASVAPFLEEARRQVVAEWAAQPITPADRRDARAKAEAGWEEHGGDITGMDVARLVWEERREFLDQVVYRAVRIARAALDECSPGGLTVK